MKNISLVILLIIITVLAMGANFNSFVFGGKAPLFGLLSSFAFVTTWVLIFRYALKNKEYNLILPSTVFWLLTFLTALITIYINITETTISFIIPFAVLFLAPLYGINYIDLHNLITLAIMVIIAGNFIYFGSRFIIINKK